MSEKKAVTIVTQATKALTKSTLDLCKILDSLGGLGTISEEMTDEIALKQAQLDNIEQLTADRVRRSAAELELKVLENEKSVMSNLMKKAGLATVSQYDYECTTTDLEVAHSTLRKDNEQLVVECDKKNAIKYNAMISNIKADHRVDVAEKDAALTSLKKQTEYMEDTITRLQETIEAERAARIQIAQADATKQAVTVNTSSK